MGVTSPDNIYVHENNLPASLVQVSQSEGASVQAALNKRQRYDFVWPTAAERGAQTGMVQGSRGYQVDTKSEYLYDNSAWRLELSHAEFTASATVADGGAAPQPVGSFSLDSSFTTNSTFVTPGTSSGTLLIANPGVYSISSVTQLRNTADNLVAPATGRTFLDLSFVQSAGDLQRVSIVTGEDRGSLACGNVNVTVANQNVWFQVYKTTGANALVKTRVRITRIG